MIKMKKSSWLFLALIITALCLNIVKHQKVKNENAMFSSGCGFTPLSGHEVPTLKLKGLNGQEIILDKQTFIDKGGIIQFFTTWCKECIKLHRTMPDKNSSPLPIYGIALREYPGVIESRHLPYSEITVDETGYVAMKFGVSSIPVSFIVDKKGHIVSKVCGKLNMETLQNIAADL